MLFLYLFLIVQWGFIIAEDIEEYEEEFEPLCDINFDGEDDCEKFFSFAATNWRSKDYIFSK